MIESTMKLLQIEGGLHTLMILKGFNSPYNLNPLYINDIEGVEGFEGWVASPTSENLKTVKNLSKIYSDLHPLKPFKPFKPTVPQRLGFEGGVQFTTAFQPTTLQDTNRWLVYLGLMGIATDRPRLAAARPVGGRPVACQSRQRSHPSPPPSSRTTRCLSALWQATGGLRP